MEEKKRKVVVIENQIDQYSRIFDKLEKKFDVYPKEDKYVGFMDCVRICVTRYPVDYKNEALKIIKKVVEDSDFVIVDYILGGAHTCDTGVYLVRKILEDETLKDKPILFFSKMEENNKKRTKEWLELKKDHSKFIDNNWLPKGYSNLELFLDNISDADHSYLDKLVERVDLLIKETKLEKVISKLEASKTSFSDEEYIDECDNLKSLIRNKSDKHDVLLDEILNKNDINYGDIERWIVQVKD